MVHMNFEIVRPNTLASNAGAASQENIDVYCPDGNCPGEMNVMCNCDAYCGNNMDCSFVAVGEGCQEVSINCLNP